MVTCILKNDVGFHLKNNERFYVKVVTFCTNSMKEVELALTTGETVMYRFKNSRFWYNIPLSEDGRLYIDGFAVYKN